jgi:hypothetical protein
MESLDFVLDDFEVEGSDDLRVVARLQEKTMVQTINALDRYARLPITPVASVSTKAAGTIL